ncbi:MAG: hypothetical protein DRP73_04505, partial [Candidatus Omnitrophota bacterium]
MLKKAVMLVIGTLIVGFPLYASLSNGGFESWTGGLPDYWTPDDSIIVEQASDVVHGGSYSAKVTLITQNQSLADFIHEAVSVSENTLYTLDAWIYDNDDAGRGRLIIRWYDSSMGYISTSYAATYSSDMDEWQELTFDATSPAGAAYAEPGIRFYDVSSNWDGDAIFHVDDFDLTSAPTGPETLTIYEIQGQADESPYVGETVVTYGIVTGVFGNNFFMEEQPGGAWHGIYVYRGGTSEPVVARGDSLRITGTVSEYYGMTELTNPTIDILASGVTVPGPTMLATGSVPVEDYEGVLVKVDNAVCTNPDLGYGEWEVDDGSGPVRVDDMGYSYTPDSGAMYMVTGPLFYSYGNYKIEPRDENDVYEYPTGVSERSLLNNMVINVNATGSVVN